MEEPTDKKEKVSILEKPVKLYWFIILVFGSAFILALTWRGGDQQVLINQISFASSASSILLALVAILYAFQSSKESAKNMGRITDKIDELKSIREEILSLKEHSKMDNANILKALDEFNKNNINNFAYVFQTLKDNKIDVPEDVKEKIFVKYQQDIQTQTENLKEKVMSLNPMEMRIYDYISASDVDVNLINMFSRFTSEGAPDKYKKANKIRIMLALQSLLDKGLSISTSESENEKTYRKA